MYFMLDLDQDEFAGRPDLEGDGRWTVYSFVDGVCNRTRDLGREHFMPLSIGLRRKLEVGLAFTLGTCDHEFRIVPDADIEEAQGLMIWEHKPGDMGAKAFVYRQQDAQNELDEFNAWLSGDIYRYHLWSNTKDPQYSSGCGGYYDALEMMKEIDNLILHDNRDGKFHGIVVKGEHEWLSQYIKNLPVVSREEAEDEEDRLRSLPVDMALPTRSLSRRGGSFRRPKPAVLCSRAIARRPRA